MYTKPTLQKGSCKRAAHKVCLCTKRGGESISKDPLRDLAHEGMRMLSTEDGDDFNVAPVFDDVEGRGTEWEFVPFTNGLYALFFPCKESCAL